MEKHFQVNEFFKMIMNFLYYDMKIFSRGDLNISEEMKLFMEMKIFQEEIKKFYLHLKTFNYLEKV